MVALRLHEHDSGRHRYDHVQVSGLLLELAWFAHVDGDHVTIRTAMGRLAQVTQDLAPHDRAHLVQTLKQLTQMADVPP